MVRYSEMRFCFFFAPSSESGLMLSRPRKTRVTPARAAFSDEARDAVAQGVDLHHHVEAQALALAHAR